MPSANGNLPSPFKRIERIKLSDLNPEFPDHAWRFWSSPSVQVYVDLLHRWALLDREREGEPVTDEQKSESSRRYLAAVSELVIDTGESGIDLSTPEAVEAAWNSTTLDGELLRGIIFEYTNRIVTRRSATQKKTEPESQPSGGSDA